MPRANVFNSHETVLALCVHFLFFLFEVTSTELDSIRFGSMNLLLLLFAQREHVMLQIRRASCFQEIISLYTYCITAGKNILKYIEKYIEKIYIEY